MDQVTFKDTFYVELLFNFSPYIYYKLLSGGLRHLIWIPSLFDLFWGEYSLFSFIITEPPRYLVCHIHWESNCLMLIADSHLWVLIRDDHKLAYFSSHPFDRMVWRFSLHIGPTMYDRWRNSGSPFASLGTVITWEIVFIIIVVIIIIRTRLWVNLLLKADLISQVLPLPTVSSE